MKTNERKYCFMPRAVMFTVILVIAIFSIKANDRPLPKLTEGFKIMSFRNATYQEILDRINGGECFGLNSTAVTVRNNKGNLYSYTSHSAGSLTIGPNTTTNLVSGDIRTAFSDRDSFNGEKDIQSLRFNMRGDGIVAQITFRSWGNATIQLLDMTITKKPFGYFITGNTSDERSTTYYTFSIYEKKCLF